MAEFTPVTTLEDLDSLDSIEVMEGHWSGHSGDGEPGNNRSRAFWHGWRNGSVDGGWREKNWAQVQLARAVHAESRRERSLP